MCVGQSNAIFSATLGRFRCLVLSVTDVDVFANGWKTERNEGFSILSAGGYLGEGNVVWQHRELGLNKGGAHCLNMTSYFSIANECQEKPHQCFIVKLFPFSIGDARSEWREKHVFGSGTQWCALANQLGPKLWRDYYAESENFLKPTNSRKNSWVATKRNSEVVGENCYAKVSLIIWDICKVHLYATKLS